MHYILTTYERKRTIQTEYNSEAELLTAIRHCLDSAIDFYVENISPGFEGYV